MTIQVKTFIEPPLWNNNYVVIDTESHEAILIDCSNATDEIMNYIKDQKASLKYILLTHGHFDHVLGVNYFKNNYHVPVYLAEKDKQLLSQINSYMSFLHMSDVDVPKIDGYIDDKIFTIGSYTIKIISTPGHTPGSVCYQLNNLVFSGDTLFHNSHGRTDFPGGNDEDMKNSLKLLFHTLSDDTIVYPGHGENTIIQAERHLYT